MDAMNPLTLAVTKQTLDLLALRQAYIAQNIANASSVDYRPVRIEFESELRRLAALGQPEAISDVAVELIEEQNGEGVRVDMELAEATQTALRFSGLIEMLGRLFALQRLIVSNTGR
ncbi:MAG: hypothetical protein RL145_1421 [Pseudomonadota bacterium]|jgi:flagellar basal-body rod protein FlgB